jgi:hypothetical protein
MENVREPKISDRSPVRLKLGQIDLRAGEKHQQQLADFGKETRNGTAVGKDLKAIGTYDNPLN